MFGRHQHKFLVDTSTNFTFKINKHAVCSTWMQGGGGLPDGSAAMQKELKRKKDYPNGVSCRTRPNLHADIRWLAIVQAHINQPDEHVCTAGHDAFARIYSLYSHPTPLSFCFLTISHPGGRNELEIASNSHVCALGGLGSGKCESVRCFVESKHISFFFSCSSLRSSSHLFSCSRSKLARARALSLSLSLSRARSLSLVLF